MTWLMTLNDFGWHGTYEYSLEYTEATEIDKIKIHWYEKNFKSNLIHRHHHRRPHSLRRPASLYPLHLNDSLMIVNQTRISDLNQHSNMNLLLCLHHQILLNSRFFVNDCTSASKKVIRNILNITSFCLILANKWLLCWIANTDADISSIFP